MVRGGPLNGEMIPLQADHVSIGRNPDNVIIIKDDRTVSRKHATIVISGRSASVQDEGSKIGTLVNNQRITGPTPIKEGDVITIATNVFEYHEG
jgi:ABC transport system ATP-binding/permease protein